MKKALLALTLLGLAACSLFEDAATSLAYDLERGVKQLAANEGATCVVPHDAKARANPAVRTVKRQFDQVGALIVWHCDASGKVLESGSTS